MLRAVLCSIFEPVATTTVTARPVRIINAFSGLGSVAGRLLGLPALTLARPRCAAVVTAVGELLARVGGAARDPSRIWTFGPTHSGATGYTMQSCGSGIAVAAHGAVGCRFLLSLTVGS